MKKGGGAYPRVPRDVLATLEKWCDSQSALSCAATRIDLEGRVKNGSLMTVEEGVPTKVPTEVSSDCGEV